MPNPTMQTTYDELVRLCYECVLDKGKWRELLTNLMQASGRQQGGILYEFEHSAVGQISEVSCFDPAVVGPYNEYYCQLDPGRLYVPRQEVGRWYHDFLDFGIEAIEQSPYYQEFHRLTGLGNISCVKLYEGASSQAFLSLVTNWDSRLPDDQQQMLLNRISSHLTTAGRMCGAFERLHQHRAHPTAGAVSQDGHQPPGRPGATVRPAQARVMRLSRHSLLALHLHVARRQACHTGQRRAQAGAPPLLSAGGGDQTSLRTGFDRDSSRPWCLAQRPASASTFLGCR